MISLFLYVLSLDSGKYYVGKTKDIVRRIKEHRDGIGSKWTRAYSLISLEHWFQMDSDLEDELTLAVMKKHGVENVRGGSWTKRKLSRQVIKHLKETVSSTNQIFAAKCKRCHSNDVNKCIIH